MDPLAVLGLRPDASPGEVAAAYRTLAKRWHPDRAGTGEEAARRMAEINAAYAVARDPARARRGAHGVGEHRTAPPAPRPPSSAAAARPTAAAPPAPRGPAGHWLPEAMRRSLGPELLAALAPDEAVLLVTPTATWKSPRALLAVTEDRLLWLLDDAISHRVHALRWRDVAAVERRLRRPLRRTAVVRVETTLGRRLEWAELPPETAAEVVRLTHARAERVTAA